MYVAGSSVLGNLNANFGQASLERAQMLVMPDIDDPFVPLGSDGLFVDPYESKSVCPVPLKGYQLMV